MHAGAAGWVVVLLAAMLMNSAFAGISQGLALLTRKEATMIAIANFIGLPLLFLSSTLISLQADAGVDAGAERFNPVNWGVVVGARGRAAGLGLERRRSAPGAAVRADGRDGGVRDLDVPGLPAAVVDGAAGRGRQAEFCEIRQMTCPVLTA